MITRVRGVSWPHWGRCALYVGPLLLWMGLTLLLSTRLGGYNNSLFAVYAWFAYMAPEGLRPQLATMYTLNYVARRLALFGEYSILTLLLVRAIQFGAVRLKRSAVIAVLVSGVLFAVADNLFRSRMPGRHGGLDDLLVSLFSIGLVLTATLFFFAVKACERYLAAAAAAVPPAGPAIAEE